MLAKVTFSWSKLKRTERRQTRWPTCKKKKEFIFTQHLFLSTYFSQNNRSAAHDPLGVYLNVTEVPNGYIANNSEILRLTPVSKFPLRHVFPLPAIIVPFVISTRLKHLCQTISNFPKRSGVWKSPRNFENHYLDPNTPKKHGSPWFT